MRASHAHIGLIGQITPQELLGLHGKLKAAGGLETRLLFALVARQADTNPFTPPSADRQGLVDRLREAIEGSRSRVMEGTDPISRFLCLERGIQPNVEMPVTLGIREGWSIIRDSLPAFDDDFRPMIRRAETHVIRLALAYAIADGATALSQSHIETAIALWSFCARSTERIFGTPTGGLAPTVNPKRRGQLFEYLHRNLGGWVSRSEIMGDGLFHGNVRKPEFDALVGALEADDLIEERTVHDTGGAPRTEYRLAPTSPVIH